MKIKFSAIIVSLIIIFVYTSYVYGWGQDPVAVLRVTHRKALVGTKVIFDAKNSYDPDGEIEEIKWDFDGDGDYEEVEKVGVTEQFDMKAEYIYNLPGYYSPKIKVIDNDGRDDIGSSSIHVYEVTNRLYVDKKADGTEEGESWVNAYTKLQDALEDATYGTEIWVAQGRYIPTDDGDRQKSFQLKDAIVVYGGFKAGATDLSERNFKAYPTILSGDLEGNDDESEPATLGDNSSHVVKGEDGAILDGFTITGGNGGISGNGAGMYNYDCSPTVSNCIFSKNNAGEGGAIYNYEYYDNIFLTFLTAKNCVFSENTARAVAGVSGHYCYLDFTNCIFNSNRSEFSIGGLLCFDSIVRVINCTFWGNEAGVYPDGVGIYYYNYDERHIAYESVIGNCIVWNNGEIFGNLFNSQIYSNTSNSSLYISVCNCVQHGGAPAGLYGQQPYFVNPQGGDFHLKSYSACINRGCSFYPCVEEECPVNLGAYGNTPEAAIASANIDYNPDPPYPDHLPDDWEMLYWGNLNQDDYGNPDGDSTLNVFEWEWFGTDPTKAPYDIWFAFDDLSDGELKIKYWTYNNTEFYSIALKVVLDGATLNAPYDEKIEDPQTELNCYIDYAHSNEDYEIGQEGAHPVAKAGQPGEPEGDLSEFSINMAAVDNGGPVSSPPGAYTELITIQLTSTGGNEADVTISVDTIRSSFANKGLVTNLPKTVQVTFGE